MRAGGAVPVPAVQTLSVPGTMRGVGQAIEAFERFGRARDVPDGLAWRVKLALDEILSNVVRHGGLDERSPIDMTFSFEAGVVGVEIVDAAAAFNPLLAPAPDASRPLAARTVGGVGITIVKGLMDETRYERRDGRNHFVMRCGSHGDR